MSGHTYISERARYGMSSLYLRLCLCYTYLPVGKLEVGKNVVEVPGELGSDVEEANAGIELVYDRDALQYAYRDRGVGLGPAGAFMVVQ